MLEEVCIVNGSEPQTDAEVGEIETVRQAQCSSSRAACFDQVVLQPPWPLQAFWPLQPFLPSTLQPPWPLQAFWPLQACLAAAGAAAPGIACCGCCARCGTGGAGGRGGAVASRGHAEHIPVTAAAMRFLVILMMDCSFRSLRTMKGPRWISEPRSPPPNTRERALRFGLASGVSSLGGALYIGFRGEAE